MNKIHQTVWSESLGQWVVASELAHGRTKSKKLKKLVAGTVLSTFAAVQVYAAEVNCAQLPGDPTKSMCDGAQTPILPDSYIIEKSGANGDLTKSHHLTVTNVMLTPTEATLPGGWPSAVSIGGGNGSMAGSGFEYGSLTLDVSNSTITVVNSGLKAVAGLYSRTDTEGATGTINSSAYINVTGNSTETGPRAEGILLEGFKGASRVNLLAGSDSGQTSSQIVVSNTNVGGSAAGVKVVGAKEAIVTTAGGTSITATGYSAHGIVLGGAIADGAVVRNAGTIETNGAGSQGIRIESTGDVNVRNVGAITTLNTTDSFSHGIYSLKTDASAYIENGAAIITHGIDSSGVRAEQSDASTSGDITVRTMTGSTIETFGANSEGIYANIGSKGVTSTTASNGGVNVTADGSIITHGNGGADGIYAGVTKGAGSTGVVGVSFIGETIETTGTGQNRGIYTEQQGAGNTLIDVLGGMIKTAGDASHAIQADITNTGAAGNVLIQATGRIETKGAGADGILVTSVAQSGDIKVVQHGNAINLEGSGAHGIYVRNTAASSASDILIAASSGQINLLQNAAVGASSGNYGILAEHSGANSSGNITVSNISTTIDVGAGNGSTQDSSAIYAQIGATGVTTGTGNVHIENGGALTTHSKSSLAEHAVLSGYNWGTGDVTVLNTGEVTAYGSGAYGVRAKAYTGGAVEVT